MLIPTTLISQYILKKDKKMTHQNPEMAMSRKSKNPINLIIIHDQS